MADNLEGAAARRLRNGPSMTPSAFGVDFGELSKAAGFRRRFDAICRLAKTQTVAVITIPAAPIGTPFDDEVKRLSGALLGTRCAKGWSWP